MMRKEDTYQSSIFLVRKYFYSRINQAIELAKLDREDVVLDVGCGFGYLIKKIASKVKLCIGVDADISQVNQQVRKMSNVKLVKTDVRDLSLDIVPTKIFCVSVLEHIPEKDLEHMVSNIKKMMQKRGNLIVGLPTENIIYSFARKLIRKRKPEDHVSHQHVVHLILKKYFSLETRKTIPFNFPSFLSLYLIEKYSSFDKKKGQENL